MSTASQSGVTFTTTPTTSGSTTEGHILLDSTTVYEWDGTSVHNRILVQGATLVIPQPTRGPATDTWLADGVTQAWPLRYTVSGTPSLRVGGVRTMVLSVVPGTAGAAPWTSQQNAYGQFFLYAEYPPPAGTLLEAWYSYRVPVVAQATDYQSVAAYAGPNGGIFAEFVSDSTLTAVPMALARAQSERTEYAFAAERATFSTSEDFLGWVRAGQVLTYSNQYVPDSQRSWARGVDDTFLCTANTVTFGDGGYRRMQVTAIRI